VQPGDFPDINRFREHLLSIDLDKLPKLRKELVAGMDEVCCLWVQTQAHTRSDNRPVSQRLTLPSHESLCSQECGPGCPASADA